MSHEPNETKPSCCASKNAEQETQTSCCGNKHDESANSEAPKTEASCCGNKHDESANSEAPKTEASCCASKKAEKEAQTSCCASKHDHHATIEAPPKESSCCASKKPAPEPAPSCHQNAPTAEPDHACCGPKADASLPKAMIADGDLPSDQSNLWICPMCPKVYAYGPAACPMCGMALERAIPSLEEDDSELNDMTRRLMVALVFTVPLFVISMGDMVLPNAPISRLLPGNLKPWVELLLATPVVTYAAWPFLVRAVDSVKNRALNMFTLVGLGVVVAYIYSVFAVIFPSAFPDAIRGHHGLGLYFESAAVITALVLLGQVLELRARKKTGDAIRSLLSLAPQKAIRVTADGRDEEILVEAIRVGDLLRVRPGESVPTDGTIVEGKTLINEAAIRGEPIPVEKREGDEVIGSTTNTTSAFLMRADRVGSDTMLSQIVKLVADAQRSQAPAQRLADKVSAVFVPAVIAIAIVAFLAWLIVGPAPSATYALIAMLSVLIIACPCALGLATPMSIMVSSGRAAQMGVLFRNAEAIETLGTIDTVILDKTGTLTVGKPAVTKVVALRNHHEETLIQLVASVERSSEHPLAAAIVAYAKDQHIPLLDARAVEANVGIGIQGTVGQQSVFVGNAAMMSAAGVDIEPHLSEASILAQDGSTVLFAAIDAQPAGIFVLRDTIRSTSRATIDRLHSLGVRVIMATGDGETSAHAVAKELAIDEVHFSQLPEQKERLAGGLVGAGRKVAMVGDGINDAPALARATIGVAMGGGTHIAMDNADVTLLRDNIEALVDAIELSRATRANIRQNLMLAFGYNALAIPIAAGILYPFTGTLLSPMIAAATMSLSSVSVISNALRLRGFQR